MNRTTKVSGIVIAAVLVLAIFTVLTMVAGLTLIDNGIDQDSISHEVEYRFEFRTNGTLNDTRLLAPYPDEERFRSALKGNVSNTSIVNEINASLSLVETRKGEMMELDIGDFEPETREERYGPTKLHGNTSEEIVSEDAMKGLGKYSTYELVIQVKYDRPLDTRKGLENEPHLNSTPAECLTARETGCAKTQVYASYNASENTHVEISVGITGRNSWWNLGWSGNSYRQRFHDSFYDKDHLVGSQDDWILLRGREEQGEGKYRN